MPCIPEGATAYSPPPTYDSWYDEVVGDLGWGATEHPERIPISWWIVPGVLFFVDCDGVQTRGLWTATNNVYLLHAMRLREGLVKHEMLQVLLAGDVEHEDPLFAVYDAIPWEP